jgi:hypothetical protein
MPGPYWTGVDYDASGLSKADRVRMSLPLPRTVEEFKRQLIWLLRENLLSEGEREMLVNELELFWFPTKALKQERRNNTHILKAEWYDAAIHRIAAAENISIADAKLKFVEIFKLHSVEAANRYIERGRDKRRKRQRPPPDKK